MFIVFLQSVLHKNLELTLFYFNYWELGNSFSSIGLYYHLIQGISFLNHKCSVIEV